MMTRPAHEIVRTTSIIRRSVREKKLGQYNRRFKIVKSVPNFDSKNGAKFGTSWLTEVPRLVAGEMTRASSARTGEALSVSRSQW